MWSDENDGMEEERGRERQRNEITMDLCYGTMMMMMMPTRNQFIDK